MASKKKKGTFFGGMLGKAEGAMKSRRSRIDAAVDEATGGSPKKKAAPPKKKKY